MKIQRLDTKVHNRSNFSCEQPSLTTYIKTQANQDTKRLIAICFVYTGGGRDIVGYYTLSNDTLPWEDVPANFSKKLPKNMSVPVSLLGRLARDSSVKGKGIGGALLVNALRRAYTIGTKGVASIAVIVDPIDDKATAFYTKYGFTQLQDSKRMFISMSAIEKLV